MSNHKKIMEDSAEFFNKEVDKIIYKVTTTKSTKRRIKYIQQMIALKNRLTLEVKMLEGLDNF